MTDAQAEPTPLEEVAELLRNQRNRWRKWFAVAGVVLLFVVLNQVRVEGVATKAQDAADRAQEAIDLVLAQRTEARLYTCLKDKNFAEGHNAKVISDAQRDNDFLVLLATDGGRRPIQAKDRAIVEAQMAENNRVRDENIVPVPDCSPKGIADFYERGRQGDTPTVEDTTTTTLAASPTSARATTSTRATTTTGRSTSTTFPSSPETTDPCELLPGITAPPETPCL